MRRSTHVPWSNGYATDDLRGQPAGILKTDEIPEHGPQSAADFAARRGAARAGARRRPLHAGGDCAAFCRRNSKSFAACRSRKFAFAWCGPSRRRMCRKRCLWQIVAEAINFPVKLVSLSPALHILELFHGPTLAFKDFGARFMARLMGYFVRGETRPLTVLVATSGDTGSAVAHGFLGVPGIRVVILYPSKRISEAQEKQFTTLGENITALEVAGSFDDCQRLVKQAFSDVELNKRAFLTSANSINIGRLLPQMFYHVAAYRQLPVASVPLIVSVPSGNFGNLTAGIFAKRIGLPVAMFIASTNANDAVPDICGPENFIRARRRHIFQRHGRRQSRIIFRACWICAATASNMCAAKSGGMAPRTTKRCRRCNPSTTASAISADPHTAVGILGWEAYQGSIPSPRKDWCWPPPIPQNSPNRPEGHRRSAAAARSPRRYLIAPSCRCPCPAATTTSNNFYSPTESYCSVVSRSSLPTAGRLQLHASAAKSFLS